MALGAGAAIDAASTVAADSVLLASTSTTGAIDARILTDQGATHGAVGPMIAVDAVNPPAAFGHGTTDVGVAEGATRTLPPGEYRVLDLLPHSTLVLSGGLYRFASFRAAEGARIAIVEDAVIDVVGQVLIGPHATIGAADGAPGDTDVVLQTLSPDVDGAAIRIGAGANLVATFRAASGAIRVGRNTHIVGSLLGRDVSLGPGVVVDAPSYQAVDCGSQTCIAGQIDGVYQCDGAVCPSFGGACPSVDGPCFAPAPPLRHTCGYVQAATGTPCPDGDPCNGFETCSSTGKCVSDGNYLPDGTSCVDGNPCNGRETCQTLVLESGPIHRCWPSTPPLAPGASCSDGDNCNGVEVCGPDGSCLAIPGSKIAANAACGSAGCHCKANQCSDDVGGACAQAPTLLYPLNSPAIGKPGVAATDPVDQAEVSGAAVVPGCDGSPCVCPSGRMYVSTGTTGSTLYSLDLNCDPNTTTCATDVPLSVTTIPCAGPGDPTPAAIGENCIATGTFLSRKDGSGTLCASDPAGVGVRRYPASELAFTDNQAAAFHVNVNGGATTRVLQGWIDGDREPPKYRTAPFGFPTKPLTDPNQVAPCVNDASCSAHNTPDSVYACQSGVCQEVPSCARAAQTGGLYLRHSDGCGTWTTPTFLNWESLVDPATGNPTGLTFQTDWDGDGITDWRAIQPDEKTCGAKATSIPLQKLAYRCKGGDYWAGSDRFELVPDPLRPGVLFISANVIAPPQTIEQAFDSTKPCNPGDRGKKDETGAFILPEYISCSQNKCGDGKCDPGDLVQTESGIVRTPGEDPLTCPRDCGMVAAVNEAQVVASTDGGDTWKLIASGLDRVPVTMTVMPSGRVFMFDCYGGTAPSLYWVDAGASVTSTHVNGVSLAGVDVTPKGADGQPILCKGADWHLIAGHLQGIEPGLWSISRRGGTSYEEATDTVRIAYPSFDAAKNRYGITVIEASIRTNCDVPAPSTKCLAGVKVVRTIYAEDPTWFAFGPHFIETNRLGYPGDDAHSDTAVLQFREASPYQKKKSLASLTTYGQVRTRFQLVTGDAWTPSASMPLAGHPNGQSAVLGDGVFLGDYSYGAFYALPATGVNAGDWELRYTTLWSQTDKLTTEAGAFSAISTDLHTNTVVVKP